MAKRPQHAATRDTVDEMESAADASLIRKARVNTISRYLLSTWIRLQPIAGIIALCITIGSMFISLMILVISNGQTTSSWKIQPTVYLAIAAALANIALNFAYARAVPVAWWYRASQGTTIRALEEQWQSSSSVVRAASHARRKPSTIIAASICVPLMFIDGALLQRASSVRSAEHIGLLTLNITLPPELPTGFSGVIADGTFVPGIGALYTTYSWLSGDTVTPSFPVPDSLPVSKGTWYGKIAGPGVAKSNCTTDTWQISRDAWHDANATWGYDASQPADFYGAQPVFVISMTSNIPTDDASLSPAPETMQLTTVFMNNINGSGNYTQTSCEWRPAHDL